MINKNTKNTQIEPYTKPILSPSLKPETKKRAPGFFKGLEVYTVFIVLLFAGFIYLQLNGILLFNSTETEREGNSHTYGSSHHK